MNRKHTGPGASAPLALRDRVIGVTVLMIAGVFVARGIAVGVAALHDPDRVARMCAGACDLAFKRWILHACAALAALYLLDSAHATLRERTSVATPKRVPAQIEMQAFAGIGLAAGVLAWTVHDAPGLRADLGFRGDGLTAVALGALVAMLMMLLHEAFDRLGKRGVPVPRADAPGRLVWPRRPASQAAFVGATCLLGPWVETMMFRALLIALPIAAGAPVWIVVPIVLAVEMLAEARVGLRASLPLLPSRIASVALLLSYAGGTLACLSFSATVAAIGLGIEVCQTRRRLARLRAQRRNRRS